MGKEGLLSFVFKRPCKSRKSKTSVLVALFRMFLWIKINTDFIIMSVWSLWPKGKRLICHLSNAHKVME